MFKHMKGIEGMTILAVTIITVLGMVSMLPGEESILPKMIRGYLPNGSIEDKAAKDTRQGIYFDMLDLERHLGEEVVIDETTLNRFIQTYVYHIKGRPLKSDVSLEDKQEIRMILEGMGYFNTSELRNLLTQEMDEDRVRQVKVILGENLFDEDLQYLDKLMGIQ